MTRNSCFIMAIHLIQQEWQLNFLNKNIRVLVHQLLISTVSTDFAMCGFWIFFNLKRNYVTVIFISKMKLVKL